MEHFLSGRIKTFPLRRHAALRFAPANTIIDIAPVGTPDDSIPVPIARPLAFRLLTTLKHLLGIA